MEGLDLMESTTNEIDTDDDVEVFRMKKKHFQAAKKYLVCINLSKYSVEKGDEVEITLNKTTDHFIISQIKEFTSEEISISNYERSLSALIILLENYLNVHFIISRSTVMLYGLMREVSSAKIDLIAKLEDPDEINMGMTDFTATRFGGKAASGQSSQETESNVEQTKSKWNGANQHLRNGEDKISFIRSSKLSHPTHVSNKIQSKTEVEDMMESTEMSSYEVVELRLKKEIYLKAKKFFKPFNLSEYSIEKGNEFEITLNKKSDYLLFSKIKEFRLVEIPIINQEQALLAKKMLSEKHMDVKVSTNEKSLSIYGYKNDVLPAKRAFLTELRNQDDINMWKFDDSACFGAGFVARVQNGQDNELKRHKVENYMNREKFTNWEQETCNAAIDCTLDRKKETLKKSEAGAQQFYEGTGRGRHLDERGQQFYAGSKSDLKVYVRKENITKLDVGIIVNAANRHLRHDVGVAKAITSAAGQSLVNESNAHITTHGPLDVTDVFVSSGGLLRAKFVMHAVGPKWTDYTSADKHQCLTDLRRTVVRCLVEASRLQQASIALPSISAAIYKVPKDLCAKCYMEAVKSFDDFAIKLDFVPVKEIRFVDVDDEMVNITQEMFINKWHKTVDGKIAHEDFKFAQLHLSKKSDDKSGSSTGKYQEPSSQETKSVRKVIKWYQEELGQMQYAIKANSIQIHIVTKPATVYRSAIVVVGQLFDELSKIKKFNVCDSAKPRSDLPKQKKVFQYLSLSKPDGSQPILMCQLHPNPDSPDNVTKAFVNLENAEEIHKSSTVVFISAIFYAKPKKGQDNIKIISRIAKEVLDFADVISSTNSSIKSILIATGEDCIPQVIKIFDSRNLQKILPGQTLRG